MLENMVNLHNVLIVSCSKIKVRNCKAPDDKRGIQNIIFLYFLIKVYVVGTH